MNNDVVMPLPGAGIPEPRQPAAAPVGGEPAPAAAGNAEVESRSVAAETAKMFYWLAMR